MAQVSTVSTAIACLLVIFLVRLTTGNVTYLEALAGNDNINITEFYVNGKII